MREPTPREQLYDWHSRALRGERMPIHESDPQCGYFLVRLQWTGKASESPLLPASITMVQPIDPETGELCGDEYMVAECMGEPWEVSDAWASFPKRVTCRLEYLNRLGSLL